MIEPSTMEGGNGLGGVSKKGRPSRKRVSAMRGRRSLRKQWRGDGRARLRGAEDERGRGWGLDRVVEWVR